MINPDEFPDQVILEEDLEEHQFDDSQSYGIQVPVRSEASKEGYVIMNAFASTIDETSSWRFHGASRRPEDNSFIAYALSRGLIQRVKPEDFGDIADRIEIEASDESSLRVMHVLRYEGDGDGLAYFAHIVSTELDHGIDGEADAIVSGPLFLLGAVLSESRWAKDMDIL